MKSLEVWLAHLPEAAPQRDTLTHNLHVIRYAIRADYCPDTGTAQKQWGFPVDYESSLLLTYPLGYGLQPPYQLQSNEGLS